MPNNFREELFTAIFGNAGSVSIGEFRRALEKIVEQLNRFEKQLQEKDEATLRKIEVESAKTISSLREKVVNFPKPKDGKDGKDGKNAKDGKHGKDGKNGKDGWPGKDGKDGKDGSPDTGEEIIVKINEDKTKKILKSKIEGLDEIEDSIRTARANISYGMKVSGDTVRYYDLSSLLDGSTKTFTLPSNRRVVGVFGSDVPGGSYVPTTDWTATIAQLFLTDAVVAPHLGGTLWILYVE